MTTATRSALHTLLRDRLGIRYPICQAGMAFVARAKLAAAVSAAGGLGVIAGAHGTASDRRDEIHTLEERVPVLIAGLGNPGPVTAEAHRLGGIVAALCGNVKQARDHAANGVDVIIAQGPVADVMASIVEEAETILHRLGSRT